MVGGEEVRGWWEGEVRGGWEVERRKMVSQ